MNSAVLLFDLDGTLTDPKPGITGCIRFALDQLGVSCPADDVLVTFIGPPLRGTFAMLLDTLETARIEEAMGLYRQRFAATGLYENQVYDGCAWRCWSRPDRLASGDVRGNVEAGRVCRTHRAALRARPALSERSTGQSSTAGARTKQTCWPTLLASEGVRCAGGGDDWRPCGRRAGGQGEWRCDRLECSGAMALRMSCLMPASTFCARHRRSWLRIFPNYL